MIILNTIKQCAFNYSQPKARQGYQPCKTYPNLKPLERDTVSFTSSTELNRTLMSAFDNKEVCNSIYENSKDAANDFQDTLNKYFEDLISNDENRNLPIHHIDFRTKTPESIREKTADKLGNSILHDVKNTFNPNSAKDIKKNINDLIGARFVLDNFSKKDTTKIIERLSDACKNGDLKIISIESYEPDSPDKNLKYFSDTDLKNLKKAANSNKPAGSDSVKLIKSSKKTGYVGLHINVDLSNPDKYVSNKDNYLGEIQILGYDVSKLKEVEDACYKLKSNKDLKRGNIAYKPFTQYFLKYLNSSPEVKDNFEEYTKRAYIEQRRKEPARKNSRKNDSNLPTIKECNMEGKVPKELDFNLLYDLKTKCDEVYKYTINL